MATREEQRRARAQRLADKFNTKNPIGTPVRYWTFLREGEGKLSKTRSGAQEMGHSAVVWVEGEASCIALTHIQPIREPKAKKSKAVKPRLFYAAIEATKESLTQNTLFPKAQRAATQSANEGIPALVLERDWETGLSTVLERWSIPDGETSAQVSVQTPG